MTSDKQSKARDGIEIHWSKERGYLSLVCESEAFEKFRRFVAVELRDFPDLELDKVVTIEVIDLPSHVTRQESPNYWIATITIAALLFLAAALAVGIVQIALWVTSLF